MKDLPKMQLKIGVLDTTYIQLVYVDKKLFIAVVFIAETERKLPKILIIFKCKSGSQKVYFVV
jgi:hypothetical protein